MATPTNKAGRPDGFYITMTWCEGGEMRTRPLSRHAERELAENIVVLLTERFADDQEYCNGFMNILLFAVSDEADLGLTAILFDEVIEGVQERLCGSLREQALCGEFSDPNSDRSGPDNQPEDFKPLDPCRYAAAIERYQHRLKPPEPEDPEELRRMSEMVAKLMGAVDERNPTSERSGKASERMPRNSWYVVRASDGVGICQTDSKLWAESVCGALGKGFKVEGSHAGPHWLRWESDIADAEADLWPTERYLHESSEDRLTEDEVISKLRLNYPDRTDYLKARRYLRLLREQSERDALDAWRGVGPNETGKEEAPPELAPRVPQIPAPEGDSAPSGQGGPPATAVLAKGSNLDDDAKFSVAELADRYGVDAERLRKRLQRWRAKNHDGWIEDSNASGREPRYLHRLGHVRQIIEQMQASGEASGVRPSRK